MFYHKFTHAFMWARSFQKHSNICHCTLKNGWLIYSKKIHGITPRLIVTYNLDSISLFLLNKLTNHCLLRIFTIYGRNFFFKHYSPGEAVFCWVVDLAQPHRGHARLRLLGQVRRPLRHPPGAQNFTVGGNQPIIRIFHTDIHFIAAWWCYANGFFRC